MSTYVCADLHGSKIGWENILKVIKPDDFLYVLGDVCDRGPAGFELFQEIYNRHNTQILMGNHEHMLIDAITEWLPEHITDEKYDLLSWNGGSHTFSTWKRTKENRKWLSRLQRLGYFCFYRNKNNQVIYLSHSGYFPGWNGGISNVDKYEILWNREHFIGWEDRRDTEDVPFISIHGHTPVTYIAGTTAENAACWKGPKEPLFYNYGTKIDIDLCTAKTHKVCLMNLDTFEYEILEG